MSIQVRAGVVIPMQNGKPCCTVKREKSDAGVVLPEGWICGRPAVALYKSKRGSEVFARCPIHDMRRFSSIWEALEMDWIREVADKDLDERLATDDRK